MVVVDLPGHGETGGRGNTLEDWLSAVEPAVDAHTDTLPAPVGFGAGAFLALSWADTRLARTWQVVTLVPPTPHPGACLTTGAEARAWWDASRDGEESPPHAWPARAVQRATATAPWCGTLASPPPAVAVHHQALGTDPHGPEVFGRDPLRSCPDEVVERVVAAVIDPRFR